MTTTKRTVKAWEVKVYDDQVRFSILNQTFVLSEGYMQTKQDAQWFARMLRKAFRRLMDTKLVPRTKKK